MKEMHDQRWYEDNKAQSKYGIVDKDELIRMIDDARKALESERAMREQLIALYERQQKMLLEQNEQLIQENQKLYEMVAHFKARATDPRTQIEEGISNGWVYG